tara:strand:- start:4680 stop:4871 length:192 start_codon:yes stop_codon:yes gene_type:complete
MEKDRDKKRPGKNQPHSGLVPPIDPNAREERELKNPDGSDLDEFIKHYSPALARQEELEQGLD